MSFPSVDIDEIWEDYKEWEKSEEFFNDTKEKYQKAKEKTPDLVKYLESLESNLKIFEQEKSKHA